MRRMMMEKKLVHLLVFVLIFATFSHCAKDTDSLFFVANSKGLDYKFAGKKDAHRFGVELKENKQFHHTVTSEDGVRLGCYGYQLDGKKYSTNYIADGKGYRLAPSQDLITVYSKGSSDPRTASFGESFNEEEIRKANIRYFFPEGCEAPTILFDPNNPSSAYENRKKLFESLVEKAQLENAKILNENKNRDERSSRTGGSNNGINGKNENLNNGSVQNANNNLQQNGLKGGLDARKGKSSSTDSCCDVDRIQIVMPQNSVSGNDCVGKTAKIIIPIANDKLANLPMKDFLIFSTSTSSSSISSMLKELQKLVDKYGL